MKLIREFQRVSSDPNGYAREMKAEGKRCIGYFCSYTPEEIIHAAGIHPMRLFGSGGDTSIADKHLQAYCCSLVRGALADVLTGSLDYLDGAVFPHTCDTMQRLSDIWRLNTSFHFFADIVLPVKLTSESSRKYFEDVLRRFKTDIEKGFSLSITDDGLKKSIETFNTIRSSLKSLYDLHATYPSILTGGELNSIVRASMILDREKAAKMLEELVQGLNKSLPDTPAARKRVMLVGSVCDQPDFYRMIEQAGADVVWDDLCTGSRYFEGTIGDGGDAISAIAERYYNRIICPAKHSSITGRGDNLMENARKHKVQGVIFLQLKFCDPHSFDYPYLKEHLDRENIPSMLLEIEGQLPPEGQLL
ncbi:MAG TPA: 2-hydroxyacyl-CoA dehydratase family protein, partial [Desulfomonilia bacterium]|nr:2-hydroxyacyl-CoA dehydratase family protein [Desulfomonilia bacterium]